MIQYPYAVGAGFPVAQGASTPEAGSQYCKCCDLPAVFCFYDR